MKKMFAAIGAIAFSLILTGSAFPAEQINSQVQNQVQEQARKQTQKQTETQSQIQNREQLRLMEKAGSLNAGTIGALRKQHLGNGEIVIAGALAKASNQPVNQIMSLRNQGMGWGEIAQKYNLKLGTVMKSVYASINAYGKQAQQHNEKSGIRAANQIRNEVQNQERMETQHMMQHSSGQMQHEMNMNGPVHDQHGMGMGPGMNGMHGK